MKTISLLLLVILLVLLAGCARAAGSVDDAARVGQAVIKNYGDDVARNSRLLAGNKALQYSDDYARMISSSLDDMLQNKPVGQNFDDVVQTLSRNSDDVLSRTPTTLNVRPPSVIYNTPLSKWTATQRNVLAEVKRAFAFSDEDAKLFLKTACRTMDYVKLYGKYPSSEYSLLFIHIEAAIQHLEPPIKGYEEFGESVAAFAKAVIKGQKAEILQKAGETAFNGLCLIPTD